MKIERFEVPGLAQFSYVISDSGHAVVIDAIRDIDRYTDYAKQHGLVIDFVLETHIHADFAAGSSALAASTGAQLLLSAHDQDELYRYSMPHRDLQDGEVLHVGKLQLTALHTPGHTPEHLSFVLFDTARGTNQPLALFSGDFLFVGSVGRPDLLGEAAKMELARQLYRSMHQRIAHLPDSLQVYPGHGAGSLCGAGMSERAESTLGYERATNPLFFLTEEAFLPEILGSVPPMPAYYPRMKKLNAQGAVAIDTLPGARALTVAEVATLAMDEDVTLLDVRRPEAFGGAHIPKSINIGAGQNLSLWAGWLLNPAKRIVLIAENGDDAASRRSLVRVGLDNIVGYLVGGIAAWIDSGRDFARTTQMSVHELEHLASGVPVLDVRSDREWHQGHIPDAQHIMLGDLPGKLEDLPAEGPIVMVCGSGYRSSIAASLVEQSGLTPAWSMHGGMSAWNLQALPLAR